jgi:hypothetical protein
LSKKFFSISNLFSEQSKCSPPLHLVLRKISLGGGNMGNLKYSDAVTSSVGQREDLRSRKYNENGIIGRPSLITLEGGLHGLGLGFAIGGPVAYVVGTLLTGAQNAGPDLLYKSLIDVKAWLEAMAVGGITGYAVGHSVAYVAKEAVGGFLFGKKRS